MFGFRRKPKNLIMRVRTMERAAEMLAACEVHGLKAIVGIEEDKPEDISDFIRFAGPAPTKPTRTPSPLDFCPCGSGRVYKKCCSANQHAPG